MILGQDYRGRGYSRDIMPRVMTYSFAPEPASTRFAPLWVSVGTETRAVSVYQSLGFVPSGTSATRCGYAKRCAIGISPSSLDALADEYDPIRSLDAFGMHVIEDNPGVKEALSARERSIAINRVWVLRGMKPMLEAEEAARQVGSRAR